MPFRDYLPNAFETKPPCGEVCLVLVNQRPDPRPAVYIPDLRHPEAEWVWNGFVVHGVTRWRSVAEPLGRFLLDLFPPAPQAPR